MKKINNILSFRELSYPKIQSWVIVIVVFFSISFSQTLGDLNNDESINVLDILRTINIILEMPPPPSEYEILVSDLNIDEEIDITDIMITVDIITDNLDAYCTNDEWDIPCENNYSECCYPITSSEFTWEIDTFGLGANAFSEIEDVQIIDENNIWTVGKIHVPDSSTSFYYNAIHWNGEEWRELIIADTNQISGPGFSFFQLSEDVKWFGIGVPYHFNGVNWIAYGHWGEYNYPLGLGSIHKIRGTSFNNMFLFNSSTDITHWDGEEYTLMETSTGTGTGWTYNGVFKNVWKKNENNIYALSNSTSFPLSEIPHVIQYYNGTVWSDMYRFESDMVDFTQQDSLSPGIFNIWGYGDTLYVITSPGLWKESLTTGEGYYTGNNEMFYWYMGRGMDGNHPNDFITVNIRGRFAHYNGETWNYNHDVAEHFNFSDNIVHGVDFKDDTIIIYGIINAMGFNYPAFIAKGTRNN